MTFSNDGDDDYNVNDDDDDDDGFGNDDTTYTTYTILQYAIYYMINTIYNIVYVSWARDCMRKVTFTEVSTQS